MDRHKIMRMIIAVIWVVVAIIAFVKGDVAQGAICAVMGVIFAYAALFKKKE